MSGSLDFYYDFKLVESFEATPAKRYCYAIDSDFMDLHFKCYEKSDDPENSYEKSVWYTCRTSWKQRVGILSSTVREEEVIDALRFRLEKQLKAIKKDHHLQKSNTSLKLEDGLVKGDLNRILKLDSDTFRTGLHAKAANYLQLYPGFINVGKRFMLAHNQFVSVYNLSSG